MEIDQKELQTKYNEAVQKMNSKDYKEALELTYKIKNDFEPHYLVSNIVGILFIDIGQALNDETIILEGIKLIENNWEPIKRMNAPSAYYNLSNGYSKLFDVKRENNKNHYYFKETELDIVKKLLIKSLEFDSQQPNTFVNLANCYDQLGRNIDALECYEKALVLDPNYGMALGNKGIALSYHSRLMGKHGRTILLDAYYFIFKALEKGVVPESENTFIFYLDWIKKQFHDEKFFDNPPKFPGYKIEADSEFKRYLIEYNMDNKLYLNICTFCQKCDASIGDTINIERMKVKLDQNYSYENDPFLRLSSYLNEIKKDYIAARFLLILSRYEKMNLDFVYDNVKFVETLDYSEHDFNVQLVKLSFKNFYDILDKIAFFINDYLSLEKKEWQIDFNKIWYSKWDKKPKKRVIHNKIINTQSYALNALFDIHWDLEDGPYKNLRITRNALTHRFVKIKLICIDETNEIMTEDTLVERTLELARIVRNTIFYLMYFVNDVEIKKQN